MARRIAADGPRARHRAVSRLDLGPARARGIHQRTRRDGQRHADVRAVLWAGCQGLFGTVACGPRPIRRRGRTQQGSRRNHCRRADARGRACGRSTVCVRRGHAAGSPRHQAATAIPDDVRRADLCDVRRLGPSVRAVGDMDGLVFPEMPWILYGGQGAPDLWDALQLEWSAQGSRPLAAVCVRFRRIPARDTVARQRASLVGVDGLTGALTIDGQGHVQRSLEFARVAGWQAASRQARAGQLGFVPEPAANPDGATAAALRHNALRNYACARQMPSMVTTTELGRAAKTLALAQARAAQASLLLTSQLPLQGRRDRPRDARCGRPGAGAGRGAVTVARGFRQRLGLDRHRPSSAVVRWRRATCCCVDASCASLRARFDVDCDRSARNERRATGRHVDPVRISALLSATVATRSHAHLTTLNLARR